MKELVALNVGVLMVSLAISYALFAKYRVVRLRQDLFDIRDQLFDEVALKQGLDNPDYRQVRNAINHLACFADYISLPFILQLSGTIESEAEEDQKESEDEVTLMANEAFQRVAVRIAKYMIKETVRGRLLVLAMPFYDVKHALEPEVSRSIRGSKFEHFIVDACQDERTILV